MAQVADQAVSAVPHGGAGAGLRLDVPGMTEHDLAAGAVQGLMPEAGIYWLLGEALWDLARAAWWSPLLQERVALQRPLFP